MHIFTPQPTLTTMQIYKVQYKNPIESCPKEMHEKIRFNIVGRSYIDTVNPGTENHLQYVKCFPNVKNMMQRSFLFGKMLP